MNLKNKLRNNPLLKVLFNDYFYYKYFFLYKCSPKLSAKIAYKQQMHRIPNLDNPHDLIEKYMWMELNTDTSLWTLCADKYRMRSYVEEKGFGEYLPKLYGHWDNPDDIDFDELPDKFVLKANNGCGTVMIVRDKSDINYEKTRKKLKQWLRHPYGYFGAQIHYLSIKPCIIAEELLQQDEAESKFSPSSMADYKLWTFYGQLECTLMTYNRVNGVHSVALYNNDWHPIFDKLNKHRHNRIDYNVNISKPECFEKMKEIAHALSSEFAECRVDFYVIKNKPVIGELTFTAGAGSFTQEYYEYLGSKIDLG